MSSSTISLEGACCTVGTRDNAGRRQENAGYEKRGRGRLKAEEQRQGRSDQVVNKGRERRETVEIQEQSGIAQAERALKHSGGSLFALAVSKWAVIQVIYGD